MDGATVDNTHNQGSSGGQIKTAGTTYFFYGSLMLPKQLTGVLRLDPDTPVHLTPASIKGFKIMLWGPYPALVPAASSSVVKGKIYTVASKADEDRLADYETNHYKAQNATVSLEDGSEVPARIFVWADDMRELEEGSFDLSTYAKRLR